MRPAPATRCSSFSLFRIRNFWVANVTTLAAYPGLIGGLFFVGLFLSKQAPSYANPGRPGDDAGLVDPLLPLRHARGEPPLHGRRPKAADNIGRSLAVGLLLLLRVGANADYLSEVLPAILVFGLGLSATVAPLTATVLDSVEERHVGIASGVNNGVARVAGLLAIAILGAVISGYFGSALDSNLGNRPLGPRAERTVSDAKAQPLAVPKTGSLPPGQATTSRSASVDASTSAFHLGIGIASRPDDRRRRRLRLQDREPEAQSRGGGNPRLGPGRRVRSRRRRRLHRGAGAGSRTCLIPNWVQRFVSLVGPQRATPPNHPQGVDSCLRRATKALHLGVGCSV